MDVITKDVRALAKKELAAANRQWKLIDTFVHHPEQFDTVTFDMEPTCRIYDIHHGF